MHASAILSAKARQAQYRRLCSNQARIFDGPCVSMSFASPVSAPALLCSASCRMRRHHRDRGKDERKRDDNPYFEKARRAFSATSSDSYLRK